MCRVPGSSRRPRDRSGLAQEIRMGGTRRFRAVSSRAAAVFTVRSCCYVMITTNKTPGSHAGLQQPALNYSLNGIWIRLNESGIYSVLYCLPGVRLRRLWSVQLRQQFVSRFRGESDRLERAHR